MVNYVENDFYPAWVPNKFRDIVDLSELAEPDKQIVSIVNKLTIALEANIAIY